MSEALERCIIKRLKAQGGYTTLFWVTENQSRAKAFDRLEQIGVLVRDRVHEGGFPTIFFTIHANDA